MFGTIYILATRDDDGSGRIFGLIVALLFGAIKLAAWYGKREKKPRVQRPKPLVMPPVPQPATIRSSVRKIPPLPARPQQRVPQQPARQPSRGAAVPAQAPSVATNAATVSTDLGDDVRGHEVARSEIRDATGRQRKSSAQARALRQRLQPASLRSMYLLTEIFHPPVSVREHH